MSRKCVIVLLTVAVSACLCAAHDAGAQNKPTAGRKLAFLVGVKSYDHSDLKNLDFPENDVEELATLLRAQGFDTIVLTTKRGQQDDKDRPRSEIIRTRLGKMLDGVSKNDMVIVGLAGHGMQLVGSNEAFFCPADANPSAEGGKLTKPQSLISLDQVLKQLGQSGAGHKLLMVDACRNDPDVRGVAKFEASSLPAQTGVLLSCSPGEFAFEDKSLGSGHGVFFYHVIEGLKGLAHDPRDPGGDITWDGLTHYVRVHVPKTVKTLFGKDGGAQSPHSLENIAGTPPILTTVAIAPPPQVTPEPKTSETTETAGSAQAAPELNSPIAEGGKELRLVAAMLPKYHLSHHPLDDEIAQHWLQNYLDRLDAEKVYFDRGDVQAFMARQNQLDEMARRGDSSMAFEILKRLRQRVQERTKLATEVLAEIDPAVADTPATATTASRSAAYAENDVQAREIWQKKIERDLHTTMGRSVAFGQAREKLLKRYNRFRREVLQYEDKDIVELYLGALVRAYDPHSAFLPPEGIEALTAHNTLQDEGVGVFFRVVEDDFLINGVLPNGPAAADGRLQQGDRLVGIGEGIDGSISDVTGMKPAAVLRCFRGKSGTVIRLQVIPKGQSDRVVYDIERRRFQVDEVRSSVIERFQKADKTPLRVGYLSVPRLYAAATKGKRASEKSVSSDVRRILTDPKTGFKARGVEVVVLDLRHCSGGFVNQGTRLAGLFLGTGPVMQQKLADGLVKRDESSITAAWEGPLVVLTGRNTLGTTEFIAAAMQEYGRALVVGDAGTNGLSVSHTSYDVVEPGAPKDAPKYGKLYVTTSQTFRLNGEALPPWGISPDLVLPSMMDHQKRPEVGRTFGLTERVDGINHPQLGLVTGEETAKLRELSAARRKNSPGFKRLSAEIARADSRNRPSVENSQASIKVADSQPEIPAGIPPGTRSVASHSNSGNVAAVAPAGVSPAPSTPPVVNKTLSAIRHGSPPLFPDNFYNKELLAITADYMQLFATTDAGKQRLRALDAGRPTDRYKWKSSSESNKSGASLPPNSPPPSNSNTAQNASESSPPVSTRSAQSPLNGSTMTTAMLIAPFNDAQVRETRSELARVQQMQPEWRNSLGMTFVLVPGGEFDMGSAESANQLSQSFYIPSNDWQTGESPQHRVAISRPFALGKFEVTKGQFRQFVTETGYVTDAEADGQGGVGFTGDAKRPFEQRPEFNWQDWGVDQSDESPVVNVTWDDAMAFCYWLSNREGKKYHLPTEAQWEFACRAGSPTRFYNGDSAAQLTQIGNVWDRSVLKLVPNAEHYSNLSDGWAFTSPSGQFQPNNFGLYDMIGNVQEWCYDVFDKGYYLNSPTVDPMGPTAGNIHVLRGGAWNNFGLFCRSSHRSYGGQKFRDINSGFRVVEGGTACPVVWTVREWELRIHRHRYHRPHHPHVIRNDGHVHPQRPTGQTIPRRPTGSTTTKSPTGRVPTQTVPTIPRTTGGTGSSSSRTNGRRH